MYPFHFFSSFSLLGLLVLQNADMLFMVPRCFLRFFYYYYDYYEFYVIDFCYVTIASTVQSRDGMLLHGLTALPACSWEVASGTLA